MSLTQSIGKFLFWAILVCFLGCHAADDSSRKTEHTQAKKQQASLDFARKNESRRDEVSDQVIPEKVYYVLRYVREHHKAPEGFTGGRKFGNYEKRLPLKNGNAKPMRYREWDVNPRKKGKNRGAERLITSENKRAWFTSDHYETFIEIK